MSPATRTRAEGRVRWHRGQSYMWRDPVLPALREGGWDPAGRTLGSAEESGLYPTFRASHVLKGFQVRRRGGVMFENK